MATSDEARIKAAANYINQDNIRKFINSYYTNVYSYGTLSLNVNDEILHFAKIFEIVYKKYYNFVLPAFLEFLVDGIADDNYISFDELQSLNKQFVDTLSDTIERSYAIRLTANIENEYGQKLEDSKDKFSAGKELADSILDFNTTLLKLQNDLVHVGDFSKDILRPDVLYNLFTKAMIVNVNKVTRRIISQSGAFILPAFEHDEIQSKDIQKNGLFDLRPIEDSLKEMMINDGNWPFPKPSVIQIKNDGKGMIEMKKLLSNIGFNDGTMYPDIEHYSNALIRDLKNKY